MGGPLSCWQPDNNMQILGEPSIGILCDIADAAMGIAFASTPAPDESFTTVELEINFFRPVSEARLRAEGKVVRRGSSIGYLECESRMRVSG